MSVTVRQETLYNAVTAIDEAFLEEAYPRVTPRVSRRLERLAAVAALAAVLVSILFFPINRNPILLVSGPFVLTADTTNGYASDLSELKEAIYNQLFNSSLPGSQPTSLFDGKDCFGISILPSDWNETYHIMLHYNLRVQYGDTTVLGNGPLDPHITWLAQSPGHNAPAGEVSSFYLLGWFYEPTDLRIEILEKDGTLVQEQTIHVEYNSLTRSYDITVIEIKEMQKEN